MRTQDMKAENQQGENADKSYFSAPPAVPLPKGGGAIKGMGKKFAANPVTGTASLSLPIFTIPTGCSRCHPSPVKLRKRAYLGIGIQRNRMYLFLQKLKIWRLRWFSRVAIGREISDDCTLDGKTYTVQRYRPRIEELFAHIERWQNRTDLTDAFWKSVTKDKVTSLYHRSLNSQIADSQDGYRIFKWLLGESYDDRGNHIIYEYKVENTELAQSVGLDVLPTFGSRNHCQNANHHNVHKLEVLERILHNCPFQLLMRASI